MRLWYYGILKFLPDSQLLAQKRECDLIWKDIKSGKQTNHILINYIWQYKDFEARLGIFYLMVAKEFKKRNFRFVDNSTMKITLKDIMDSSVPFKEHNFTYLQQCYFNLQEKYMRGQRDFTTTMYNQLTNFYKEMRDTLEELDGITGYIRTKSTLN